jgi:hypothetical protein
LPASATRWQRKPHIYFATFIDAGNYDKSAASFCRQMAAHFPYISCNFYFMKNQKTVINSTTAVTREEEAQI